MNFLSITLDDLNAFAFLKSLYGGTLHTPNIDRLMAMGTTFENAFAQVALCNPSRTSVLSGQNPGLTGVHHNLENWYDTIEPGATLPGMLKSAGFSTSLIGKVFHSTDVPPTVSGAVANFYSENGINLMEDSSIRDAHPYGAPVETHSDYISADHAIEQLNLAGDKPFAMFLGLSKPHLGWVVPQQYFDLYPVSEIELPFTADGDLSDIPQFMQHIIRSNEHASLGGVDGWKLALQGYFASISFADAMIGRVLDTLEANGQMDDTAIVLWTDHGYHLGDKDNWHKFTLWEEAARAPVVVALPGVGDDGQRVSQVVELVDIMPTALDLMGLEIPPGLSGRSLLPFIQNPALTDGGVAVTMMYGSAALRTNEYRYIRYEDGSTELYDIQADPHQFTNLAADPAFQPVEDALDAQLRAELAADNWHLVELGEVAAGSAGGDHFVLGPGALRATGGAGDDDYFVNDSATLIVELAAGGRDRVFTSTSFVLPNHVEDLQLAHNRTGAALTLAGNDLANVIAFARGRVFGLGGDDHIIMMGPGSVDGGDGNDLIEGARVADIIRGGNGNDNVTGMSGDDLVLGGAGNDDLMGGAGNDDLRGEDGDDILFGSFGADLMIGGLGNDLYFVDSLTDRVLDALGAGRDKVSASIDYLLPSHIEDLVLSGGATAGVGNALANSIGGNDAGNILQGMAGSDTLFGRGGADLLRGWEGADVLFGGSGRDMLDGGTGNDDLRADAGDDVLDGSVGADVLRGGLGDDFYIVDDLGDRAIEATGEGHDRVRSSVSYFVRTAIEELVLTGAAVSGAGNNLANRIFGTAGDNLLQGMGGDDALTGGDGVDMLGGGDGADLLLGGSGADTLKGGEGIDDLRGDDGDDVLDGFLGADLMQGGLGDDLYHVGDAGDRVMEAAGAGRDRVIASVSCMLSAGVEELILAGTAVSGTGNGLANAIRGTAARNVLQGLGGDDSLSGENGGDMLRGGEGADLLVGGAGDDGLDGGTGNDELRGDAGNDVLDGQLGADTMRGGIGDDRYVVDDLGDRVLEAPGAGRDRVTSSVDYILRAPVEDMFLSGGATSGIGNALANRMVGTALDNVLQGLGGDDSLFGEAGQDVLSGSDGHDLLFGGAGDDELRGGAGHDDLRGDGGNDIIDGSLGGDGMYGGAGDDLFFVDNLDDRVAEAEGAGQDRVTSSISYMLTAGVEDLVLTGGAVSGAGNTLNNRIYGTAADNVLQGLTGDDMLFGGIGNDLLRGWAGIDLLRGGLGDDRLDGGNGGDDLLGDQGNDQLDGGQGADTLRGGLGDDDYVVDDAGDRVVEDGAAGSDSVAASVSYRLGLAVENLSLTGSALSGTGNALANRLVGNAADNVLQGLGGDDLIDGGAGNDMLGGGDGLDRLSGGGGDDRIDGGLGDDDLLGEVGNDLLDGGSGADMMRGGAGDDLYLVDDLGDRVVEDAEAGIDAVGSSLSYRLGDTVENLILTGTAASGTGNDLANRLDGNGADNLLQGLGGDDVILGAGGADTLRGGDGSDRLTGGAGDDSLEGGQGRDELAGGAGGDLFEFGEGSSAALREEADIISDFTRSAGDRIGLSAIDADAARDGNQAFAFLGDGAFSGVAGQLRSEKGAGFTWVEADLDGDRVADFVIRLDGERNLVAADFLL